MEKKIHSLTVEVHGVINDERYLEIKSLIDETKKEINKVNTENEKLKEEIVTIVSDWQFKHCPVCEARLNALPEMQSRWLVEQLWWYCQSLKSHIEQHMPDNVRDAHYESLIDESLAEVLKKMNEMGIEVDK